LTAAHTLGYQTMERQAAPFVVTALICTSVTVILQVTGFAMSRSKFRVQN
jgi:hypothetical protein